MYRLRSVLYESGMNRRAVGLKRNPTCSDTKQCASALKGVVLREVEVSQQSYERGWCGSELLTKPTQ